MTEFVTPLELRCNRGCDGLYRTEVKVSKYSYQWVITEYSSLRIKCGNYVKSTIFAVKCGKRVTKWNLAIHLEDWNDDDTDPSVAVHLECVDLGGESDIFADYKLSLSKNDGESTTLIQSRKRYSSEETLALHHDFMKCSYLQKVVSVTICCNLTIFNEIVTTSDKNVTPDYSQLRNNRNLILDVGSMRNKKKFSDVTIVVGGRQFYADKVILTARSSVFAAMFQNDTSESLENLVKIEDIEADVFERVLEHIYTGNVPEIPDMKSAEGILYAADKYFLHDLGKSCQMAFFYDESKLTNENVAQFLILAERHDLEMLKALATDHVVNHLGEVIRSSAWKALKREHPEIVDDVLDAVATKLAVSAEVKETGIAIFLSL